MQDFNCELVKVKKSLVANVHVHIPSMHGSACFDVVLFFLSIFSKGLWVMQ